MNNVNGKPGQKGTYGSNDSQGRGSASSSSRQQNPNQGQGSQSGRGSINNGSNRSSR